MAFPETNYPSNYDSSIDRTNNVDMVDESDFDYHDKQIIRIQQFIGKLGKYIGQDIVGAGIAGALSHIASGGEAFRFAARSAFSAGTLFSLGHSFDTIYQEKLSVSHAGRIWAAAGLDIVDGSFLRIPVGGTLPGTFEAGRLFFKTGSEEGLKVANGSEWLDYTIGSVGAASEAYAIFGINTSYEQIEDPVPMVIGQQMFDGSKVNTSQIVKFRVTWNPTMTSGTSYIRLYDIGPKEGPFEEPTLIKEFSTTTSGLQYDEQILDVDASGPALNTIKNNSRIYEVVVFQDGTAEDRIYIGSAVLALELDSLPTGTELGLFDVWAFGGM